MKLLWASVMILGTLACRSSRVEKATPFNPPKTATPASAESLIQSGQIDLAMAYLERNLQTAESAKDLFLYGRALRMRGRHQDAIQIFERAGEKDASLQSSVHRELANIYLERGEYSQALSHFKRASDAGSDLALCQFLESFRGVANRWTMGEKETFSLADSPVPMIELKLEGFSSAQFIVDTGASFSAISSSLANRIGVFQRVEGGILLDLEGKPLDVSYAFIGLLEMGSIRYENVPVLIVDDQALRFRLFNLHSVFEADGVLGMSFLRNFRMDFDFPARKLHLSALRSGSAGSIPLFTTGLNLYAPVICQSSTPLAFRLDTGSNQSFLTPYAVSRCGLEMQSIPKVGFVAGVQGWGASLREVDGVTLQVGDFALRELTLPIMVLDDPTGIQSGGMLGMDILGHFRLSLDPYLMTMSLER